MKIAVIAWSIQDFNQAIKKELSVISKNIEFYPILIIEDCRSRNFDALIVTRQGWVNNNFHELYEAAKNRLPPDVIKSIEG